MVDDASDMFSVSPVLSATLHCGGKHVSVSSVGSGASLPEGTAGTNGDGTVAAGGVPAGVGPLAATLGTSTSSEPISRRRLCPEEETTELPSGPLPTFSCKPLMPTTSPGRTLVGPL